MYSTKIHLIVALKNLSSNRWDKTSVSIATVWRGKRVMATTPNGWCHCHCGYEIFLIGELYVYLEWRRKYNKVEGTIWNVRGKSYARISFRTKSLSWTKDDNLYLFKICRKFPGTFDAAARNRWRTKILKASNCDQKKKVEMFTGPRRIIPQRQFNGV